jgi:hypothetical protein
MEKEYGKTYLLWRDGEFIGEAIWTQDSNIGDSFIAQEEFDGQIMNVVYEADSWVEKAENF